MHYVDIGCLSSLARFLDLPDPVVNHLGIIRFSSQPEIRGLSRYFEDWFHILCFSDAEVCIMFLQSSIGKIVQPGFMPELKHSLSNLGSFREEVFQEVQVLFRVGWKLEQNWTFLLSKKCQCHSKSLRGFNRSLPELQNVSNLSRGFEREHEIISRSASP